MSNVASVLKSEISRLSKRVVRQHVAPVQSATAAHRKQLASLRKQLQELQRQVSALQRVVEKSKKEVPAEAHADGDKVRFSAKGLRSLRKRLDLSAEDFGKLVKVTGHTIYGWEGEKSSPRPKHLPAIAELRNIGKREARARLEKLNGG
jgi:DNA-binding transcriptional regulator YiaG